ncbi:MAG: divalent metal cation transporter [Acidiphilium sp.]|nr:divalent metal cation transporter [Acidiphilium sp.]MDD4935614.1 divalent metal cation transporter [Acidiphilium sp.]
MIVPPFQSNPSHEDYDRARDHQAINRARRKPSAWFGTRLLLLLIGPGVVTFLGENDAPSMLSYAATGAQFGIGFFLPFVVFTFAIAFVVQEMAARIGAATGRGHAEMIFARFGRFWGGFAMLDLTAGNFLTLVTEFIGIRAGLGFFGVPPIVAVGGSILVIGFAISTSRYRTWERIVMGLALGNAIFIPVAILAHPNFTAIGHAMLTWRPLPGGLKPDTITLMIADIGATVTPWMLFFQQGAVADKGLTPAELFGTRTDTLIGTIFAAMFGIAAIVATAPLFAHGISTENFQAAQFAEALQPLIGHLGAALFAIGIFEAGLVAAIAISTSSAYAFGEVFGTAHSLNAPLRDGWRFYAVLLGSACAAGGLTLIPGAPLEEIVILVNVVATLAMPPALLFLIVIANDAELMGQYRNGLLGNIAGIGVTMFLVASGLAFAVTVLFPHLFG